MGTEIALHQRQDHPRIDRHRSVVAPGALASVSLPWNIGVNAVKTVNGRMAMQGFVIGLGTKRLSDPKILDQLVLGRGPA
jgi:hypothetical protein